MTLKFHPALLMLVGCIASCQTITEQEEQVNLLPAAGLGINGITILVKDLDSARNYYTSKLGFSMPEKFDKGLYEGTLSAYLSFADFSSLELVGIDDSAQTKIVAGSTAKDSALTAQVAAPETNDSTHKTQDTGRDKKNLQHTATDPNLSSKESPSTDSFMTAFVKQYEGVRLYSISTASVDSTGRFLRTQGFKIDTAQSGRVAKEIPKGWDWDDGGPQWRNLVFDTKNPPADLPSFMEVSGLPYQEIQSEWTPYAWRKYYGVHANGVVGLSYLQIVVSDLKAARKKFRQIGMKELDANDSSANFQVANSHQLHLMQPSSTNRAMGTFLKTRGPGVYAIGFEIKNFDSTAAYLKKNLPPKAIVSDSNGKRISVSKDFAYGVQLEFNEEPKEQGQLAKIYGYKEDGKLDTVSSAQAAQVYTKFCSLCHGKDREGYAADFAPSLRSRTLFESTQKPRASYNYLSHAITYGRPGTAMAPYAISQGGPLNREDIDLLIKWMYELSGVTKPIEMSAKPVKGNVILGKEIYNKHCTSCHGANGEGITAPALANPMLLATASDAFLRHTISEGRDRTPMPSFKDSLSANEINSVTAFLRSRASGWNAPAAVSVARPLPKDYILNPTHKAPVFTLRDNLYVPAKQVLQALKDSSRMIILDARSEAGWNQSHIPGAISVPYYKEPEKFIKVIPNDGTMIVVYCACPHAASSQVVNTLKRYGYKHTAIIDEGVLVWARLGYPVEFGQLEPPKKKN